jgi:hypothetical protein
LGAANDVREQDRDVGFFFNAVYARSHGECDII